MRRLKRILKMIKTNIEKRIDNIVDNILNMDTKLPVYNFYSLNMKTKNKHFL